MSLITTPVTQLFKIKHPVILAGMDRAAGPELAAAVTNAGGLGVIGGYGFTPKALRVQVPVWVLSPCLELTNTCGVDCGDQRVSYRQARTVWC